MFFNVVNKPKAEVVAKRVGNQRSDVVLKLAKHQFETTRVLIQELLKRAAACLSARKGINTSSTHYQTNGYDFTI